MPERPWSARRPSADLAVLGEALFRLADPGAAAVALEGARQWPEHAEFLMLYSRIAFAAQDFQAALDAGLAARRVEPGNVSALQLVVIALLRMGDYAGAERTIAESQEIGAADQACLKVQVYGDQGLSDEALAEMKACEASPNTGLVNNARTNLPDKGASISSDSPEYERMRAVIEASDLMDRGAWAEAETAYEKLLAAEPWNAAWRACYAVALLEGGKKAKARKELDALFEAEDWITINPTGSVSGITTKGREKAVARALEQALARLVRSLSEDQQWNDAHTALRKAEARFGRTPALLTEELRMTRLEKGLAEAWKVAPNVLRSWPYDAGVQFEVSRLVFEDAGHAPADVVDLLVTNGSPESVHNTVAGMSNAKAPDCGAVAWKAAPRAPEKERAWVRETAYSCALDEKDLALADTVVAAVPAELDPRARVWHAQLRYQAGRPDDAAVLARTLVDDPQAGPNALSILGLIAVDRNDGAELLRLAAHPLAPPAVRLNAAVGEFNDGRYDEARKITAGIQCAGLEPGVAEPCAELLSALESKK